MSKRFKRLVLTLALLSATPIWSQQDYVGLFDVYSGFAWLDSPSANLAERGYHLQAGISARTWLSLGFDFTTVHGNVTLVPNLLTRQSRNQTGEAMMPKWRSSC